MNYVAKFYKSNQETRTNNAAAFFKNVEMTEEVSDKIDVLKATIKKAQKEIQNSEEEIKELSGLLYSRQYESIENKYVLRYSNSRSGGEYYFSIPSGMASNPADWAEEDKTIIIEADNKTGTIYMPVGYIYEMGAVVARKYRYSINGSYSKANFNILETYLVGVFDGYCYSTSGNETGYCGSTGSAILRRIQGAPFLEKFYGIDNLSKILTNYTLDQVKSDFQHNKSFEIILKTAPNSIKKQLLSTSFDAAQPVYRLMGLKKETWDAIIERKLEEYVYELGSWLVDPTFNKTEMEWIEFIEYINNKERDLDFYEISYAPGYRAQNSNGQYFSKCRLIGGLAYNYNRYECFHKNYSFGKFADYVIEETINQGYTSIESFVHDLRDYLQMCAAQNIKPTLYSSYLKQTHDIASRNYKLYVSAQDEQKFEEHYKDVKAVYYDDYVIMPPKGTRDVRQEGNSLNHCVASYIKRIIDGETTILFLRKKEKKDESLITLEVRDGGIVQARGAHNRKVNKEEFSIIKRYAANRELQISSGIGC